MEIWFLFISATTISRIFWKCMEIYQWPSFILTHTGIFFSRPLFIITFTKNVNFRHIFHFDRVNQGWVCHIWCVNNLNFVPLHCVNNFIDMISLTETLTHQDKSKYLQYTFIYHFLSLLITILQILYNIRLFHAYEHAQPVNSVHE